MGVERRDEDIARDLMSRALGVPIQQNDDGSAPQMFDFRFQLKDGRRGAAEMTTVTDEQSRAWQSQGGSERSILGSRLQWLVWSRGHNVQFKEVIHHLQLAAPLLEAKGLSDPRDVPASDPLAEDVSVRWLRDADIQVRGVGARAEHRGRVHPMTGQAWSFVGESLDPTLEWLEALLTGERYDGEFAKLASSGLPEQHLVLLIDLHGVPHANYFAMTDSAVLVPTRPPVIPGRFLTGLWLIPEISSSLVWWTADGGWQRLRLDLPA